MSTVQAGRERYRRAHAAKSGAGDLSDPEIRRQVTEAADAGDVDAARALVEHYSGAGE